MTEAEWLACGEPEPMLAHLGRGASPRKLRLFTCACARRVLPPKPDSEMATALAVAESFADGQAARAALARAREALGKTQRTRNRRWGVLYSDHVRSVPAWHAARDQIATGARDGTACAAWASTRERHLGYSTMTYPEREYSAQAGLLRDSFGNPFRSVAFDPNWRTSTVTALASQMYDSRDFSPMPILADALQDADCDSADILSHCRGPGPHIRGCWVVDLVLGKE